MAWTNPSLLPSRLACAWFAISLLNGHHVVSVAIVPKSHVMISHNVSSGQFLSSKHQSNLDGMHNFRALSWHARSARSGLYVVLVVIVAIVLLCACLYVRGPFGRYAMDQLRKCDIGIPFSVGDIVVNPFYGVMYIHNATISNPPGYGYDEEHLMTIKKIVVDIDMQRLVGSRFKKIAIERLVMTDVTVVYATKLSVKEFGHSNVHDVNDILSKKFQWQGTPGILEAKTMSWETLLYEYLGIDASSIEFQEVNIKGVRVENKLEHLADLGTFQCEDICCKNFHEEVGQEVGLPFVFRWLLQSILKSIFSSFILKHSLVSVEAKALHETATQARKLATCCGGMCSKAPK